MEAKSNKKRMAAAILILRNYGATTESRPYEACRGGSPCPPAYLEVLPLNLNLVSLKYFKIRYIKLIDQIIQPVSPFDFRFSQHRGEMVQENPGFQI
jgi:hypothetical protein